MINILTKKIEDSLTESEDIELVKTIDDQFPYPLDNFQKHACFRTSKNENVLVTAHTGSGKCFCKNTPILMFDGTIKMVQDVKVGDLLMGDDSTSRKVLNLASGSEMMYNITLSNGDSFTCNESHILCLKHNVKNRIRDYKSRNNWEARWFLSLIHI